MTDKITEALKQYDLINDQIETEVATLQAILHGRVSNKEIDWADVGSVGYVLQKLKEINEFMGA